MLTATVALSSWPLQIPSSATATRVVIMHYSSCLSFAKLALAVVILLQMTGSELSAHEVKSRGETVYVPIYSTIAHWTPRTMDLSVTLSIRNIDPKKTLKLMTVDYFDTPGKRQRALLEMPKLLGPYQSTQFIIKREDFPGDIGANAIVSWVSQSPLNRPLIEAIMIGSDGAQAYSFSSRGVVVE